MLTMPRAWARDACRGWPSTWRQRVIVQPILPLILIANESNISFYMHIDLWAQQQKRVYSTNWRHLSLEMCAVWHSDSQVSTALLSIYEFSNHFCERGMKGVWLRHSVHRNLEEESDVAFLSPRRDQLKDAVWHVQCHRAIIFSGHAAMQHVITPCEGVGSLSRC